MEEQDRRVIELSGDGMFKTKDLHMQKHVRKTRGLELTKSMNRCNIVRYPYIQ